MVMATVFLKSRSGRSLLQERQAAPIDAAPYLPSSETISKALAALRRHGFEIEAQGVTLSISGSLELFEHTCGVKISAEEKTVKDPGRTKPVKQYVHRSSQPIMRIPDTDDIIDGIVIAGSAILFEGES